MSAGDLDDLRAQALHARQRLDLYRARAYGMRPTSPVRMGELERAAERAASSLSAAESRERRARAATDSRPRPS
jgi:hypothetical protein